MGSMVSSGQVFGSLRKLCVNFVRVLENLKNHDIIVNKLNTCLKIKNLSKIFKKYKKYYGFLGFPRDCCGGSLSRISC